MHSHAQQDLAKISPTWQKAEKSSCSREMSSEAPASSRSSSAAASSSSASALARRAALPFLADLGHASLCASSKKTSSSEPMKRGALLRVKSGHCAPRERRAPRSSAQGAECGEDHGRVCGRACVFRLLRFVWKGVWKLLSPTRRSSWQGREGLWRGRGGLWKLVSHLLGEEAVLLVAHLGLGELREDVLRGRSGKGMECQ